MPPDERRFGSYVLEHQLAKGGMAEVWRARRVGVAGFARPVCVKQILPLHADDPSFLEMFIDEARTGAQLRHGNIVGIEDFGQLDDRYFIAMEFVPGTDVARLLRHLAREGRLLPIDVAVFIAREVLLALDYAHRKLGEGQRPLGIVHRDVSPHNVLVSYAGEVKLTDFGIAKAASRLHQTRGDVVKGKIDYMAPEQASVAAIDGRADLFAVGVMFYEMLTGKRPFSRSNESDTLYALLRGDRQPIAAYRSDVPDLVVRVIDRLLARKPEDRYAHGSDALADLAAHPVGAGTSRQLVSLVACVAPAHPAAAEPLDLATLPSVPLYGALGATNGTDPSLPPIGHAAGGTEIAATWAAERDAPTLISDARDPAEPRARSAESTDVLRPPSEARETSPTDATRTMASPRIAGATTDVSPRASSASIARSIPTPATRAPNRTLTLVSLVILAASAAALAYALLGR